MQHFLSSTRLISVPGLSCDVDFSPFYHQVINSLFLAVIPTCINIPVIIMIIQHVRSSQNTVRSVRRIHRRLTIQFIVLYTIWLVFFLPQIIFMLSAASSPLQSLITKIFDIAATLSDVVVITLFDRRFIDAWKKSLHRTFQFIKRKKRRVNPVIIDHVELPQMT